MRDKETTHWAYNYSNWKWPINHKFTRNKNGDGNWEKCNWPPSARLESKRKRQTNLKRFMGNPVGGTGCGGGVSFIEMTITMMMMITGNFAIKQSWKSLKHNKNGVSVVWMRMYPFLCFFELALYFHRIIENDVHRSYNIFIFYWKIL